MIIYTIIIIIIIIQRWMYFSFVQIFTEFNPWKYTAVSPYISNLK